MTLIKEKNDRSKRFWVTWESTKWRMSVVSVLTMDGWEKRLKKIMILYIGFIYCDFLDCGWDMETMGFYIVFIIINSKSGLIKL